MAADRLTDEERQLLLELIDTRMKMISGRLDGADYIKLMSLRRKLEGVDKRVTVES